VMRAATTRTIIANTRIDIRTPSDETFLAS
jgi:hypothetical protein